jgi:lactate dehydrogenase-like 2-hydroxyacid dehydrogenase
MAKPDVLLMCALRPRALAQLQADYTLHRYDLADDPQALLAEVGARCRAVVTNGHTPLAREQLAQLPKLEIVSCVSAGFESIDVAELKSRGIPLTNTSVALLDDVADLALLLVLATRRQLISAHEYVRSGEWAKQGMFPLLSSLRGKRTGIVGLGQIGLAIARRLEPMGLEIGYTARSEKPCGYRYHASLLQLAEWAQILIVTVPGGPETAKLIDADVLRALGAEGTLINISRGSVVDEAALIAALQSGQLGSAGLDVFASEPNPDPALTQLNNVTLYPHHASGTVETRDAMAKLAVDNLAAHFAGQPLLSEVC